MKPTYAPPQDVDRDVSRRQFLETSAAAAALATLGTTAYAEASPTSQEPGTNHEPPQDPEQGGTWVTAACWHNCGGRCMNKVLVKDGTVVRQKTDDTHEDSVEYPQQRGCVRGKAQQQQCFGEDRLLYPLKRKHWEPGGGAHANEDLRGKDEWERISWDEAISLSCQEITRIRDTYGNKGFYCPSPDAFVNAIGGSVTTWDTTSFGTCNLDVTKADLPICDLGSGNDRFDMKNVDYIVMYSSNPTWSAPGTPTLYYEAAREAGVRFVSVDPMYSATAQMLDAEWVPVRGGTDMAFMLGAAYEMLRLDEEEGDVVDWDFLDRCAVGFDADHMPADATPCKQEPAKKRAWRPTARWTSCLPARSS